VSFAAKHHQRFTIPWMDNDPVVGVDILHHQVHGGSIRMNF
jgi:hypothetical protein